VKQNTSREVVNSQIQVIQSRSSLFRMIMGVPIPLLIASLALTAVAFSFQIEEVMFPQNTFRADAIEQGYAPLQPNLIATFIVLAIFSIPLGGIQSMLGSMMMEYVGKSIFRKPGRMALTHLVLYVAIGTAVGTMAGFALFLLLYMGKIFLVVGTTAGFLTSIVYLFFWRRELDELGWTLPEFENFHRDEYDYSGLNPQ